MFLQLNRKHPRALIFDVGQAWGQVSWLLETLGLWRVQTQLHGLPNYHTKVLLKGPNPTGLLTSFAPASESDWSCRHRRRRQCYMIIMCLASSVLMLVELHLHHNQTISTCLIALAAPDHLWKHGEFSRQLMKDLGRSACLRGFIELLVEGKFKGSLLLLFGEQHFSQFSLFLCDARTEVHTVRCVRCQWSTSADTKTWRTQKGHCNSWRKLNK